MKRITPIEILIVVSDKSRWSQWENNDSTKSEPFSCERAQVLLCVDRQPLIVQEFSPGHMFVFFGPIVGVASESNASQ